MRVVQAEFKNVSEKLQATVKELMDTKADRREILALHESRFTDAGQATAVRVV